ncbi:MAG: DEAD/DEAH box helicase family protein, partial [Mycoplasmataceae bacterium]|nr:DEAD/DEAH box helicase family protein [Mycoplasmataceae bacterium]
MDKIRVWLKDNGYDEKEYQLKGIEWCRERELVGNMAGEKRVYGGLLADEMGLGKTVTMLAQIVGNELSRTLIVVPKILLQQWKRTIEANTNKKVWLFHGEEAKISEEKLKRYDIVLTTYGMVSLVSGRRANIIYKIKWDRAIFDEAHHLKNSKTAVFKGVSEIKRDITWLVTGTPIQNRKTDFYSLCYCMGLPSSYYTNEDNLMDLVEKFMLKRTKAEVGMILPDLTIKNETVAWGSEEEKSLAENFHGVLKFTSATINKDFGP